MIEIDPRYLTNIEKQRAAPKFTGVDNIKSRQHHDNIICSLHVRIKVEDTGKRPSYVR